MTECCRFFEDDLGIPLRDEEESGKLFPVSNQAKDVLDALLAAANRARREFGWVRVSGLEREGDRWLVRLRW